MGYKILGFAVWRASRWYIGRRVAGARGKIAAAGVGGLILAGVLASARGRAGE